MYIDFLLEVFKQQGDREAIIWQDKGFSYEWMLQAISHEYNFIEKEGVKTGSIVSLEADFSPNAVALFLALIEHGCIVVPLTSSVESKKPEYQQIAEAEKNITVSSDDQILTLSLDNNPQHEILLRLKEKHHPGLILFSSGSTGKSKAAVHDFIPLLDKFKKRRHAKRILTFLLFDHIGGINTLLHTLANGGCVITVQERTPDVVCSTIEKHHVEILPVSPTFINLIFLSEAYKRYDLSSLELVTYGTEVMPESTLQRFHSLFPQVRLQQTYGLSEVGILRSKSKSSDSLWVKVGGEDFETRIVEGMLEIKALSSMLGYLNAPSPFTSDGWLKTGDAVEVDGEYLRILGRKSEMINVGGEKVYPAEVESIIQMMDGVEDISVIGKTNSITGQIVQAKVKLSTGESVGQFRRRLREFCKDKLASYKIPQKVVLVEENMHGERFKKMRR